MCRCARIVVMLVAWICTVLFSTPAVAGMVSTPSGGGGTEAREALAKAVKARAAESGAGDRIPAVVLAAASVPQLTLMLEGLKQPNAGYIVTVVVIVVICLAGLFLLSLLPGGGEEVEEDGPSDVDDQHETRPCSFCYRIGNGRCGYCSGDGKDEIYNLTCPRCHGSGDCYNCGGTGRVR